MQKFNAQISFITLKELQQLKENSNDLYIRNVLIYVFELKSKKTLKAVFIKSDNVEEFETSSNEKLFNEIDSKISNLNEQFIYDDCFTLNENWGGIHLTALNDLHINFVHFKDASKLNE